MTKQECCPEAEELREKAFPQFPDRHACLVVKLSDVEAFLKDSADFKREIRKLTEDLENEKELLGIDLEAHDVCCVQCMMKGEYMTLGKIKKRLEGLL